MEELKSFLEAWVDVSKRDKAKLKELYLKIFGKEIEDCTKCESKAVTDLRRHLFKLESNNQAEEGYQDKKYVLKPGNHQIVAGDHLINNSNLTDELAEFYIANYPHCKVLFDKLP